MDSLRVMLVDDNLLVIEDLKDLIPWEKYGLKVAAEASDGKQALDLFMETDPDVVIADIKMPIMDGLDFCREALSLKNSVKIILLTAYKDFEYAKRAIEIGVSTYILKHEVNGNTLLDKIRKIREEIESERSNRKVLKKQALKNLLGNVAPDGGNATKSIALFDRKLKYTLLAARPDIPFGFHGFNKFETQNTHVNAVDIMKLSKSLEEDTSVSIVESVKMDKDTLVILVSIGCTFSEGTMRSLMHKYAKGIHKTIIDETGVPFSVVYTSKAKQLDRIYQIYDRMEKVFGYSLCCQGKRIICKEDMILNISESKEEFDNEIEEIRHAFKDNVSADLTARLDDLFTKLRNPPWNVDVLTETLYRLSILLNEYRKQNGLTTYKDNFNICNIEKTPCYTIFEITEWFMAEFAKVTEKNIACIVPGCSKKIQQAVRFIHENYSSSINADDAAKSLCISRVYLFQLFRKETGKTFVEYLTEYRMEKARELLDDTDYRIYEIAEKVGYKTGQYFSRIFQKYTGNTPVEYRNRKVKQQK